MKRIVGIDIGNSTTEAALAEIHSNGEVKFLSSAIASTTGIKGTRENIVGLMDALKSLIRSANLTLRGYTSYRRCGHGNDYRNHNYGIYHDRAQP